MHQTIILWCANELFFNDWVPTRGEGSSLVDACSIFPIRVQLQNT